VAAVTLGTRIIEKHICLSRSLKGPDRESSLEPQELKAMVEARRTTEPALGVAAPIALAAMARFLLFPTLVDRHFAWAYLIVGACSREAVGNSRYFAKILGRRANIVSIHVRHLRHSGE
jgi:hypothetical protein